ncbi:hypothetical protein [Pantoea vagans]|uniref:DUF5862 family protein n=1 Tax=Pantoea vagans TaxID=470934 RepID=UPI0028EB8130|nr:hypothetical protein [Pantoea vagans]
MRTLKQYEVSAVSGGAVATADEVNAFFEGIVWGALDGLATGVTVGGSASRDAVFGIIAQGVGAILGGIIGPIAGAIMGAMVGRDAVAAYAADFRKQYSS